MVCNFHIRLQSTKSSIYSHNKVSSIFPPFAISGELSFTRISSIIHAFRLIDHNQFVALLNFTTRRSNFCYSKTTIQLGAGVEILSYYVSNLGKGSKKMGWMLGG